MKRTIRLLPILILLALALFTRLGELVPALAVSALSDGFQTFVTIFLGIFIEAAPFLLAGSLVSGLIEVFVDQQTLLRFVPRQPAVAALTGAALGLTFPVCECGVVLVTRRLHQKGLPLSMGIAFLLAAPVVNPVVIASTYAVFGMGPMLIGRIVFSFLIAFVIGLIFHLAKPKEVLLPQELQASQMQPIYLQAYPLDQPVPPSRGERAWQALTTAGDDFLDMARYLIIGSMIAAGMQTLVPQSTLLAIGQGPLASVLALLGLAFVLSICSTTDAFVALAFVNIFTPASILGFLVFGPMVDIKSLTMFLGIFQRRTVLYLILLPLLMTMLLALYLNLNVRW
jgi:uncharacterized membrane protein YraQ (UPF0718 family)